MCVKVEPQQSAAAHDSNETGAAAAAAAASASGSQQKSGSRGAYLHRARKNVVITLLLTAITHIIMWTPNQTQLMMSAYGTPLDMTGVGFQLGLLAVYSNSCINPVIYMVKYERFRHAVNLMASRLRHWRLSGKRGGEIAMTSNSQSARDHAGDGSVKSRGTLGTNIVTGKYHSGVGTYTGGVTNSGSRTDAGTGTGNDVGTDDDMV